MVGLAGCKPEWRRDQPAPTKVIKAIWVTRWDYVTPVHIATIMENARQAGYNTVLFQVRGEGTVFYRSRLEPWAEELGGRDPGFDPLRIACREGHRRGLSVHAWVNVLPGWRGKKPPVDRRQLYHCHPEWFLHDRQGRPQPLGWYVSLNPCLPEVRSYLVDVMGEIVRNYPVDGLHLDYIRFPIERTEAYNGWPGVPDYPRDRKSLALFRRDTNATPDQAPDLWLRWRCDQVTRLVAEIRQMMRRDKPRVVLTAAVGVESSHHREAYFQEAPFWAHQGLVDALYLMNYTSDVGLFETRVNNWKRLRLPVPVITGIQMDKRSPALVGGQLEIARQATGHFATFAYNSMFERLDSSNRPLHDEQSASRASIRRSITPRIRQVVLVRN